MRRYYDAARALGMSKSKIKEEFKRRNQLPLFKAVEKNKFVPFTISSKMEESYDYQSKKYGVPNVLNNNTRRKIKRIIKRLKKQRLNQPYRIDKEDYISALPNTESPQQVVNQPLPQTPQPAKMATAAPQINPQTGLTRNETALLSPSEQEIARRT